MFTNLVKSILHNVGVLAVGFVVGAIGLLFDSLLHLNGFQSEILTIVGIFFLISGFLIRVWATYYFYEQKMKVIVLQPQSTLLTSGPYRFSRNPLYLGGNVFIFFGAAFVLGSIGGCIITFLGIIATNIMIQREEKQLEQHFGEKWVEYRKRVPRWF